MLEDHLIQSTVCGAITFAITHHPANPNSDAGRADQAAHGHKMAEVGNYIVGSPKGSTWASDRI